MSRYSSLETTEYFVLLALAEGPKNGQAIAEQIIGDSIGGAYLGKSTLYATIKSLERNECLMEAGTQVAASGHVYRRYYRLTEKGQRQLADMARMHERAARLAKSRLGLRF